MSKYLKPPNDLLTQEILLDSLQRYVLIKLAPVIRQYNSTPLKQSVDDDGKKIIQKILDNSDHQLRMYGPAEELAENLKIFRDFPFSHEYFEADRIISSPVVYNNLKGEKFISKLDLIMVLQNMAIEISPGQNREHTLISLIRMLREHIQKYSSLLEFVKFDEKWFEEIEKQMREVDKLCPVYEFDFAQVKRQLASGDFTQIISKVPRFGSKPRTEAKEAEMCGVLKTFNSILGPVCRAEQINNFFTNAILLETLATIIEENSETFFKNSVTAVRVFEDGSQRFVMKAELFNAISNGNKFKDDEIAITTISMKEVEGIYGHRVKHVEFLRTPIIRARHRAVRVRGYVEEEYCSLASDAFFEFFRTLIIGEKIFQICTNLDFLVTDIYGKLEDLFKLDRKTPFFVRDETTETWKMRFDGELEMKLKTKNRAKDIRNAKIDGFTLQNLKNELIHLGLTNAFPEIVNHAEVVYLAVDGIKKGKYLSTSDLFEAVFHSQLICIFNRYPRFKTFLHNQSGCGRVLGYTCDLCQKTSEQKELEALKSEKKLLQNTEKLEKLTLTTETSPMETPTTFEKWSLLKDELKLYCIKKMDFKTKFLLRGASRSERRLLDSYRFNIHELNLIDSPSYFYGEFMIEDGGEHYFLKSNDAKYISETLYPLLAYVLENTNIHWFQSENFPCMTKVMLSHFKNVVPYNLRRIMFLGGSYKQFKWLFNRCATDSIATIELCQPENERDFPIEEFIRIPSIGDIKTFIINGLKSPTVATRMADYCIAENVKIGTQLKLNTMVPGTFDKFISTFKNRIIRMIPDKLVEIGINSEKRIILNLDRVNNMPGFGCFELFVLSVVPPVLSKEEFEKYTKFNAGKMDYH